MRRKSVSIMKSKIFLLALCAIALISCQDNTPECNYHKKVLDLKVTTPDWKFDSTAMQFYFRFDLPEITSRVYDYGSWNVYREYLGETKKDDYQVALPQSVFCGDTLEEDVLNYYTQYIDYSLGVGFVEILVSNSDRIYGEDKPESMHFRLQANDVIKDLTINQDSWIFDKTNQWYFYRFEIPEITADIYNYGHFSIFREYNEGTADAIQAPLPMSVFLSEVIPAESVVHYTQYIDYRVGIGYLDMQLTNSDYIYGVKDGKIIPPDTMFFRLHLTY